MVVKFIHSEMHRYGMCNLLRFDKNTHVTVSQGEGHLCAASPLGVTWGGRGEAGLELSVGLCSSQVVMM